MHAYLSGVGIEIMANSDNVLRGGLTPKHVDVEELINVTNAVVTPAPFIKPSDVSSQIVPTGVRALLATQSGASQPSTEAHESTAHESTAHQWSVNEWLVPVDDFRLLRFSGHSEQLCALQIETRPVIALCTQGEICLAQGADVVPLIRGESAIVGNSVQPLCLSGSGVVFLALAGQPNPRG